MTGGGGCGGGGGISGLNDPMMKGTHLTGAMPPHHLQQIHDVSALKTSNNDHNCYIATPPTRRIARLTTTSTPPVPW